MTNLLERNIETPAETPIGEAIWIDHDLYRMRLRTLSIIAAVGLAAAVVMGLFWMSARQSDDALAAERDAAVAERDAGITARQETSAAMIATQSELNSVQTENLKLQDDLDQALADVAAAEETALTPQAENELAARVNELTVTNQELSDQIAEMQAAAVEVVEEPEVADAAVVFDATSTPEFARYIGELLSGRTGSSRLAQAQSECFGAVIINDIGLNALGQGLNLSASAAENNIVVGAMQAAANFCNIPAELIF